MAERNYQFDNMRAVLIFLVLFGHFLETIKGAYAINIYLIIYSFHMPLFIYITGYFAKFQPKKIVLSFLYPYVLFQILYIAFQNAVLGNSLPIQFTTPHWIMWYLLATIAYYCLVPILKTDRAGVRVLIFLLSVALSLVAGFVPHIGYYLSLSRILTFMPYFVLGYYSRAISEEKDFQKYGKKKWVHMLALLLSTVLIVTAARCIYVSETINGKILYGAFSYAEGGYTVALKAFLLLLALCWIFFFLVATPKRRIPVLSSGGANTFPIFLFHGFFVYWIRTKDVFVYSEFGNMFLAAALSLALAVLLGNKYTASVFRRFFTGYWIESAYNRIKNREGK